MNTLQTSLYAIAIAYCLFCAGSLSSLVPRLQVRYFSLYLLLAATSFIFEWLLLHPGSPKKPLYLALLMNLSLFVAPCLWFCVREVCENRSPRWTSLPLRQRWLIALGMGFTLPLFSAVLIDASSNLYSQFIHTTMLLCILIISWQVPYYSKLSRALIRQKQARMRDLFSTIDDGVLNALRLLLLALCIKWLVNLMRTLHCMTIGMAAGWELNVLLTVDILATLWVLFVIFKSNRQVVVANLEFEQRYFAEDTKAQAPQKYKNSGLESEDRQRIKRKLQTLMKEEQAYTESSLNLRHLSERLGEKPHYLSQVINQEMGMSFYEWVNSHRIKAAKHFLKQRDSNIIDIAEAVGFNSKSTFNTAFRRIVGTTPSAYREAHFRA